MSESHVPSKIVVHGTALKCTDYPEETTPGVVALDDCGAGGYLVVQRVGDGIQKFHVPSCRELNPFIDPDDGGTEPDFSTLKVVTD